MLLFRLLGALREVRAGSALTGVQFAAWGGMFSTIDCCLVAARKKASLFSLFSLCSLHLSLS